MEELVAAAYRETLWRLFEYSIDSESPELVVVAIVCLAVWYGVANYVRPRPAGELKRLGLVEQVYRGLHELNDDSTDE